MVWFVLLAVAGIGLTQLQVRADRSVFEPFFGTTNPLVVMTGTALIGAGAMAYLQNSTSLDVIGPGSSTGAILAIAWMVPLFTLAAIGADLSLGYPEDTNVAMPNALRFYPAIAIFVELALHVTPIAGLVSILGEPTGFDSTFWSIALLVALIEATLQAAYASSISTSNFNGVHLMVFGTAQVWMFTRFGFVWMLGFRLTYYALWHLAWGAARLKLLF